MSEGKDFMDKTKWSERDLEEFEKLCAPLVEFLQQRPNKYNPYSWIIIQWNGVAFMPDSFWFPFKEPDLMDKIKCRHCGQWSDRGIFASCAMANYLILMIVGF